MLDKLFKGLASIYMIDEIIKNAEERSRRIQQEEYDEQHNEFARYQEDEEFGGHWETKDGRFDGDLIWVESKNPKKPYLIPRYISVRKTKENEYTIKVDFTSDKDSIDEYECMNTLEAAAAIKIYKEEYEKMGATVVIIDKELAEV
jgi:hypothetical protein